MSDNGFHEMATCPDCRKIGRIASKALGDPTPVELDTRESTEVGLVRLLAAQLAKTERERDALRSTLIELRLRLHAAGRRPEECYEMSIIDAALERQP